MLTNKIIIVKNLGLKKWIEVYNQMKKFTKLRNCNTFDEVWFTEHYPIFTQGIRNTSKFFLINKNTQSYLNNIPIISTDRGGQITYHGPGQQIVYFLINLQRRNMKIRQFIDFLHFLIIDTLNYFSIKSHLCLKMPGVYINNKKICSLGLRVIKGCTLHGISLNVDMDLSPFNYIYPCGDATIKMTQTKNFNTCLTLEDIRIILVKKLSKLLHVKIINKKFKSNVTKN